MAWGASVSSTAEMAGISCLPSVPCSASPGSPADSCARSAKGSPRTAIFSIAGRPTIAWRASRRNRWTAPTGDRCWIMASGSISTAGTTTWRPAIDRPWRNRIRGWCGLPSTSRTCAVPRDCCRSKTWAFPLFGSTTMHTVRSVTSNVPSICMRRPCSSTHWHPWPMCLAKQSDRHSTVGQVANCARPRCAGSGLTSTVCLSTICPGWRMRRNRAPAIAHWPPPSCSISARTVACNRRATSWRVARAAWDSPIRAMRAGDCGRWRRWAVAM